ncbi:MAG: hypothetical protein DI529_15165 [Chryseobacterium sp.]|nr:MAG: hypothetical protein DI529_15165 [Chryseobacterium sp.]
MTKIEEVLNKIKTCRKNKGFSHEYMAYKLDISQASYTNIENQTSRLSAERLIQIAEILEEPVFRFFNEQVNNEKEEVLEASNDIRVLINELVKSKDTQINILRKLLEK